MRDIAKTLGKKDWDFNYNPCDDVGEEGNWRTLKPVKGQENAVTCNCSIPNHTFCHVVSIILKKQNLPGKLPPELVRLPYLYEIDLTRNYLNGTIPPNWASLKLLNMYFLHFSSFEVLEFNQFSGDLPPQLGNLINIERLFLTSNNFTGELPSTFAKLTALKDIRLGDNQFSGKIPNFIQHWTRLEKLVIQGSGFSGPIPSQISHLENLRNLWISDLNGSDSTFPQINNSKSLKTLVLKSCNINGSIPDFWREMTNLTILYLTGNLLYGTVPHLSDIDYISVLSLIMFQFPMTILSALSSVNGLLIIPFYPSIEGSCFLGSIVLEQGNHFGRFQFIELKDLSYNNFTSGSPGQEKCQQGKVGSVACMRSTPCPKTMYSFHINCGGSQVKIGDIIYDEDSDRAGQARFGKSSSNWVFSSTGHFLDGLSKNNYICESKSKLSMPNAELYMNARLSSISLTYYGFCLGNGPYKVKLHFAEIMFTDDETFSSLGRRVFDVYIQGKRMLKDFNIANEAGIGKECIQNFTVNVTSNSLEIRFYWAGKGTTAIPDKSVYGPLVSAISVESDFEPPKEARSISGKVVAVIVALGVIVVILTLGILWWKGSLRKESSLARELKDLDVQTGLFTLRQIKAATNNFDISNKIGEGGFGPVYKGFLSDGSIIAVKQLSSKSKQGNREFINEIGMISALNHPCLVKLYGCCVEGDQLLLAHVLKENDYLMELVDRRLGSDFDREDVMVMIDVALLCTNPSSSLRPSMSSVLSMLEGKTVVPEFILDKSEEAGKTKLEAMRQYFREIEERHISETDSNTKSLLGPSTSSSTSAADLYPISPDSSYLEKRN
ncbi:putative leucine-rich repeat receptor-like serine/threonine-protein kinase [Senna tora]|uniref:non-specific serine/threonine protein kinase n=1 Tax=Senna tora TaxID=362788 RepID=A0A834X2Y4_9FABA|nr:putative leucine-rich repeat receptor-like serine/threonine-protein kinase [Senna tora]